MLCIWLTYCYIKDEFESKLIMLVVHLINISRTNFTILIVVDYVDTISSTNFDICTENCINVLPLKNDNEYINRWWKHEYAQTTFKTCLFIDKNNIYRENFWKLKHLSLILCVLTFSLFPLFLYCFYPQKKREQKVVPKWL